MNISNVFFKPGHPCYASGETFFKKGKAYPFRVATQFKPGNYRGYPSRAEWAANWKRENMISKKLKRRTSKVMQEARSIQDEARRMAPESMEILGKIMRGQLKTEPAQITQMRLESIDKILNRAYGKPAQTNINANVDANGKANEISSAELDKRIATALERVEELTGRAREAKARKKRPVDLRIYNRDPRVTDTRQ